MADLQRNAVIEEAVLVDLIQRAQNDGDPTALDGLYLLYADRIFRYLLARLGDALMAEEVTSQVFMHLIQKLGQYRISPQDNVAIFSAWFYRLAYNKMIDIKRKQSRTRTAPIEYAEQMASKQHVLDEVIERISIEEILQKLQVLSGQQREVILLRFVEGCNIAETAAIMDKSEGAIKALQHRALENLRRYFLEEQYD
jgi:RNA polymerase sigma-70 factor (ECF subfamily)